MSHTGYGQCALWKMESADLVAPFVWRPPFRPTAEEASNGVGESFDRPASPIGEGWGDLPADGADEADDSNLFFESGRAEAGAVDGVALRLG